MAEPMKIKWYKAKQQLLARTRAKVMKRQNDIHEFGEPFAAKALGEKPASIVFMTNAERLSAIHAWVSQHCAYIMHNPAQMMESLLCGHCSTDNIRMKYFLHLLGNPAVINVCFSLFGALITLSGTEHDRDTLTSTMTVSVLTNLGKFPQPSLNPVTRSSL